MRGCIFRSPDDIYIEGRPGDVAGAQLIMIDGHILCSDRLRIDAIEQGHRATGKDARRNVARLCRLLRRLGDDGDGGRVKRCPHASTGNLCAFWDERRMGWRLGDFERELEALRLGGAGDVQKLEVRVHAGVESGLLFWGALAGLGHDRHGEGLLAHLPYGALDVDEGRRA